MALLLGRTAKGTIRPGPRRARPGDSDLRRLLFGPLYVPEDGLLPRVATQERTEVFSAKPCGPYLYVRAPVTRASGVRHQVLCRRRARAHVLKALAGHEPMAFFALPERLRLQTEHVDVDVVDVSSPTSRTEIPDEDTPAPVGSPRRQLPFDYGPLEEFVQPACLFFMRELPRTPSTRTSENKPSTHSAE